MELLAVIAVFYFIPSIIAANRGHHNTMAIFAINLLAGWAVFGWFYALIWSLTNDTRANDERQLRILSQAMHPQQSDQPPQPAPRRQSMHDRLWSR
jgi:hypothetical protein